MVKPEVMNIHLFYTLLYRVQNQEQMDWVCKKYDVPTQPYVRGNNFGATHTITGLKDIGCLLIVGLPKSKLTAAHAALAAHEATHCCQSIFESVGEHSPGHETEAYLLQDIVQFLLTE